MANAFRCKIPHKKAFFAVLTDPRHAALFNAREHEVIARHVPWTRVVREGRTSKGAETFDLVPWVSAIARGSS